MSVIKQPVTHIIFREFGSKYRVCGVTIGRWIVRQRIIKDRELAKKYAVRLAKYYRVPIVEGNPLLATAGTALLTGLGFGLGAFTARKLLGNYKGLLNPIDEITYRRELIAKIRQAIKGKRIIFQPQWLKTEQLEQFWKKVRIS